MSETNQYIAEGFSFSRPADAQLASIEKKKVAYLESRMDYTNPKEILKVYEKAIADRKEIKLIEIPEYYYRSELREVGEIWLD